LLSLPGGRALTLGVRTLVMGVLNVTPDSFSDGGTSVDAGRAVELGLRLVEAGADILDIGGESTRPGARPVSAGEERARVIPVIEALASRISVPISVDTYKSTVAAAAIGAGAAIINDVSGLRYDPTLGAVAASTGAPLVLMHTRGRSGDMYREASYHDVIAEVLDELRESIGFAIGAGVPRALLVVDPGVGFAKHAAHSFEVLARLHEFADLGCPVLVGPSRKSFLTRAIGAATAPTQRDWATAAAITTAVLEGAHIVRVHAVSEMLPVVRVADEIRRYHQES
jgi:dihydropteroate synthase